MWEVFLRDDFRPCNFRLREASYVCHTPPVVLGLVEVRFEIHSVSPMRIAEVAVFTC